MYTKLKEVMRSKGYEVSEGSDWASTDTTQFTAFAKFVLGAQNVSPNQVLAYPEAFPTIMEALKAASSDEIDPPAADAAAEANDVSAVLQPEDAEPAADTTEPAADSDIDPPADAPVEAGSEGEQPAEESEQPADDASVDVSGDLA